MKLLTLAGSGALLLALAACNANEPGTDGAATTDRAANASRSLHSASGRVTELSNRSITIAHGPVDSLAWPAMTMTFMVSSPEALAGVAVGQGVAFQFREAADGYEVTSIAASDLPDAADGAAEQ